MGLEVLVSEEKFAATYPNGEQILKDYRAAMHPAESGKSSSQIARLLEIPAATIRDWRRGAKPKCVSQLEQAETKDLVPLYRHSKHITALSRLASWTFWTGNLEPRGYTIEIVEKTEKLEGLVAYFKQTLGFDANYNPKKTFVTFSKNSRIYGRVLSLMGVPVGRKSKQELHIPKTIKRCPELQKDFLHVLLATRAHGMERRNYWAIQLMASRQREHAEVFSEEVRNLINQRLGTEIEKENLIIQENGANLGGKTYRYYAPTIFLEKQNIIKIIQKHPELIEVKPNKIPYI